MDQDEILRAREDLAACEAQLEKDRELARAYDDWAASGYQGENPMMAQMRRDDPAEYQRLMAEVDARVAIDRAAFEERMRQRVATESRYYGGMGLARRVKDGFRSWRYRQP